MASPSGDSAARQRPARRGDQVAAIAEALRADIIGGALPADSPLRQEVLAARFGVSRMPVREALGRLDQEGFVILSPNRGARVAPVSADDLREIYEMRVAAETLALRLALPELSNAQIERAAEIQTLMETAAIAAFGQLNTEFHKTLYGPCGRRRLLAHIDGLSLANDRYLRIAVASLDYADTSHEEHRALLRACRRRDEKKAVKRLARHIEDAGEALAKLLESSV